MKKIQNFSSIAKITPMPKEHCDMGHIHHYCSNSPMTETLPKLGYKHVA